MFSQSPARFSRAFRGLALAAALSTGVVSCAPAAPQPGAPATAAPAAPAAQPAAKLLLGGVTALTGPSATFGEGARMGSELAAREINARGGLLGRPIEMVFRDDEANPTKAVQVFQELISNQRVKAILGPINTPNALAVAPAVSEARVVNLQITTGTATVDPAKHPFIFRPQYYARQEAEVMLEYFARVKGYTKLAILADATGYGQGGVAELKPLLQARGLQLLAEEKYNSGDTDMTGQLGRIINSGAQGILAWGLGHELAQAAKGLEKLGSKLTMIGASGITTVGFRQLAGPASQPHLGVYSRRFSFTESAPTPAGAREFVARLDATFGKEWSAQTVVSAPWYEAVYLYAEAVKRAGTDDPEQVKRALEGLDKFPANGIYTTYSFSPTNRNGFQQEDLVVVYAAGEEHGLYRRPPDAP
ncbi:MAG: ABC transporter substrate-binding protein [Chloroflexi bacterium]|nr:ABC transporter substrate-binding protein [Chloroflexota bacterium]